MKPDRPTPSQEKLEATLASWLRSRDAGSAPERLHVSVAAVTRQRLRGSFAGWLRPVPAVVGACAIALMILVAVALRSPGGDAVSAARGSAISASPSSIAVEASLTPKPEVSSSESPPTMNMPYGPWPRTGRVPAIPLDDRVLIAAAWTALLLAGVLLVVLIARSALAARQLAARGVKMPTLWRQMSRRTWVFRGLGIVLVTALTVTGAGLFNLEASAPLAYGSFFGGGTRLLGTSQFPETTDFYSFVPSGELDLVVSLSNSSDLPLTVTAFDEQRFRTEQPGFAAFVSTLEVRLPRGASDYGLDQSSDYPEAFHPFELQAGAETSLLLVVHLKACRSTVAPGPTPPAPSSVDSSYVPPAGWVGFDQLPFRYSMLGIERGADAGMSVKAALVFGNYPVACDG